LALLTTIDSDTTIEQAFFAVAGRASNKAFLCAPADSDRGYHPGGFEITYAAAAAEIRRLMAVYRAAGLGHGSRVAVLLENRPEYFLHKLALNAIGTCVVPINPDYRASEIAYLLDNSQATLIVTLAGRRDQIAAALNVSSCPAPMLIVEDLAGPVTLPPQQLRDGPVTAETQATILYTSGTTGRPKGCVLSQGYELICGAWYASRGGLAAIRDGEDRVYNPLPVYHANSAVLSFYGMMLTGNCQIQADRFHPHRWWNEVKESRATMVHYLGVIVPLLLGRPPSDEERGHCVRFALGAGVEPQLHAPFEQRFGFPLIEVWAMTEMLRLIADSIPPRRVGTRAFGRADPGIEVRVVDDDDHDQPDDQPGEMIIRHSAATPRKDFFSGYLGDDKATEHAWRGGWFHTGDVVRRDRDGMLYFVDRKKNIIRRSGENIAAAEIEAVLQTHGDVKQVAVLAVPDEMRDEEVLACVVLNQSRPADEAAAELFAYCYERLAYFKAPGWIFFTDTLPVTGTQKLQKHQIFPADADPRRLPGMIDLRHAKRRDRR
jgi:crotonobetaine/carnitine-CoA ligase